MTGRWMCCVLVCWSATGWAQCLTAQDQRSISPEAHRYLTDALDIMEGRSLKRASVDWQRLRADAFEAARGAQRSEETHPAIHQALWALGDGHSRLIPPESALPPELRMAIAAAQPATPEGRTISESVGYVRVPAFSGPDPDEFAREIMSVISGIDGRSICAWIVDVRGNTGGNMWPMLGGLLPILGEGVAGYFVPPEGEWIPWHIETAGSGAFQVARRHPPVAVLHDSITASSGEAVVVAFQGRPKTRSFGHPTAGLSTANETIELDDGATMLLTVSVFADRDRNTYGGSIVPDEPLPRVASDSAVLTAATKWLLQHPECLH